MIKLPATPTPKQFKLIEKEKERKILTRFITDINIYLNRGDKDIFKLPSNAYNGFMVDVRNHFEEYGWDAKLFGSGITLRRIKE